ncbi:NEAT domain-containing protein [Clostridium tertium]
MLKRKICQLLAAVMIATTVLSGNFRVVGATELDNTTKSEVNAKESTEDGKYEVSNNIFKVGTEEESKARKYIEDKTIITVEDGKITMTMKYTESGLQYITGTTAKVNGVAVRTVINEDKSVTFEVPSIDSKVEIEMTISVPQMGFTEVQSIDLVNDMNTLVKVEDSNSGDTSVDEEENVLEDGKYEVSNAIYKVGTEEESRARKYIEDKTTITVKDGKITMTMKYTESGLQYITGTTAKVNGVAVSTVINEDKSVTFEVPSIDSKVEIEMTISVPQMGFTEVQSIDLVNDMNTLEKVSEDSSNNMGDSEESESENTGGNVDNSGNSGNENSNDGSNAESSATKTYTIKNEVTHQSDTGLKMARQALEEVSKVELIDGKYYVTLKFTSMGSTMMKDHIIYVNGNKVDATKSVSDNVVSLRFVVGSLEDSLKVSAYVDAMGSNVDFGVNLLNDTLVLVDSSNDSGSTGNTENTTEGTTSGSESNTTSGTTSETNTEEETKVTVGKLYSIKNNVKHESATGQAMARKYLNEISNVEEIEGQYYVTLTFTGAELMQNHMIYVNGSYVSASKTTSGYTTSFRFKVSSLSDTIKVKVYVVPMAKEVEFEVELLEDTLTFIKEYEVETLPQTGAVTSSATMAGLGLILTSAGAVLVRKRK